MKRADRSLLTNWWFQVDWWILGPVVAFAFVGLLSGIHSIHLLDKILLFYSTAAIILFFGPMIGSRKTIVGLAWAILAACLVLFVVTYVIPHEIYNSKRWAYVFGFSLMPADLMKPAFIILTAWFVTEAKKRVPDDFIGSISLWRSGWWPTYLSLFALVLGMMFFHPDLGNMFMYLMVFGAMIFWAGAKWRYILGAGGLFLLTALVSLFHSHFRARLFGLSDGYQVNRSLDAIKNGGLWGRAAESFLYQNVPMANNDFVFAGLAEMWGAVVCTVMLAAMFLLFSVMFRRAVESRDEFSGLVIFGAAMLFAIHIAMNVLTAMGLFMKGTTLPFISYGGSSLVAFSFLFAIVLALVRIDKWGWAK